jgi:hypothetical protein
MHPTIQYEITKARIADLQRRASQDAIAHAARRGHRALILQRRYPAAGLARRVVSLLASRGRLTPARSRPGCRPSPARCQACA